MRAEELYMDIEELFGDVEKYGFDAATY